jgi:Toprim-like
MAQFGQTFYTKDLPSEYLYNKYFNNSNSFKMHNQGHKIDAEHIKAELLNGLRGHLKAFYPNGKIKGNRFYIGNIHGDKGESLVITLSGRYAGKGKDFATGESFDILDIFAYHFSIDARTQFYQLLQRLSEYLGLSQSEAKPLSQAEIISIRERQEQAKQRQIEAEKTALELIIKKQETALKLWNEAICINHPTAQAYLQARGLDISFNRHVLRFIESAWHSEYKQPLPCIIALVRSTKGTPYIQSNGQPLMNIQTGKPILEYKPLGIERHYLPLVSQATAQEYKKWFSDKCVSRRMMLGSKKGGVIKLNDSYKDKLVLCEGLFDALTLLFHGRELGILSDTETPNVYAFLGINNLTDIIIEPMYQEIYLLADNDSAGLNSIELLRNNHSLKGRTDVKIETFKTNSHKDLNELWLSKLKEKPERSDPNELNKRRNQESLESLLETFN